MRRHLTNAGFGVLDYVSYPIGMLLVAPIVLHKLGSAEYGLWMIATAVISAGGIIASGFVDACTQRVAHLRGTGELALMRHAIRSMLGINLVLGLALAFAVWIAAPYATSRVADSQLMPPSECLVSLRVASVAILIRAIESVPVGAQRAFEQYRATVQISTVMRFATLGLAGLLALAGRGTASILVATAILLVLGTAMQFRQLGKLMHGTSFWPSFHAAETRLLFGQGFFVWLQAMGGVVFGQLDRILLGVSLGALAVTPYSLCVQFAHPIYGLTASGLNFLFPYLSSRATNLNDTGLKQTVFKAFLCNLVIVTCGAAFLLLAGNALIRIWAGAAVVQRATSILPPVVLGSALMGLSVTGTYTLQALSQFKTVAFITLTARGAMLLLMIEMLRHAGLQGLAYSRLFYGSSALLVYLPLIQKLNAGKREQNRVLRLAIEVREGSNP
jgi:O-antigen/teichoic acid export membrane protein